MESAVAAGRRRVSVLCRAAVIKLLSVFLAVLVWVSPGVAAELVMFESVLCEWCEAWHREIGFFYHKTDEGRAAPLRRVDIGDTRPTDLLEVRGLVYTPTFVLMNEGAEVGRILGYGGEDHFWGLLAHLLRETALGSDQ
jgi:hypothetical protein